MKIFAVIFMSLFQCMQCVQPVVAGTTSNPPAPTFQEVKKEAEKGNTEAQYALGRMYQIGKGVPIDNKMALEWFTKAAEKENANAQYNLGVMYQNGDGVALDKKKAVELISRAAEQGFVWAEYTLGVIYQNGDGVPVDGKKAVEWFVKAAEKGNAKAQFALGMIYENRMPDDERIKEIYARAVQQKYIPDQYFIPSISRKIENVREDKRKAIEFYRKAAEQGFITAQLYLGWMYFGGIGIERSEKNAFKFWAQAAKRGDKNAQHNIEILCRTSPGACTAEDPNPETEMWNLVKSSSNFVDVDKFIAKYPNGQYADSAYLLRDQILRQQQELVRLAEEKKKEEKDKQRVRQAALVEEKKKAEEESLRQIAMLAERKALEEKERRAAEAAASAPAKTYTDPVTKMEFVYVSGGCFQLGDNFGEGQRDEVPVHEVCVDSYYLGKFEVTQVEYRKVTGKNPSFAVNDRFPVERVSWDSAQDFIGKLNDSSGNSYRLPSEAEWEYAAREGGKKVRFGNGKDTIAPNEANYGRGKGLLKSNSVAVGRFPPNGIGLYDMSGNVWEWCSDVYGENYYQNSPRNNPEGPISGLRRVYRGGGWSDELNEIRATRRNKGMTPYNGPSLGFRLALSVESGKGAKVDR